MKKIVILVSGRGSNMIAIADACRREGWPAKIAAVIANRPDAQALGEAARLGLPTRVLDSARFEDRAQFDLELAELVDSFEPSLVVLAGYMRILSEVFVDRFAGRLVNIHPSLLPAFPGLRPHRQALQAGVKLHGATVHLVGRELDCGPIIMQAAVPVLAGDDEASLADRVLQAEHRIYPLAVRWLIEDRLELHGQMVKLLGDTGESQARVFFDQPAADDDAPVNQAHPDRTGAAADLPAGR
ncbi:MAG: phosphoribosylglycinamide formyltransferase [Quisquiliibacterium sp.]